MKKLIILMMALSLVVFALPALAQIIDVGSGIANNNMVGNTAQDSSYNKGASNSHVVSGPETEANYGSQDVIGSNNNVTITDTTTNTFGFSDTSITTNTNTTTNTTTNTSTNTATITSGDTTTGSDNVIYVDVTAVDSVNGNQVFWGDMEFAHQYEYQFAHQNDHQVAFEGAFTDSRNVTPYMPISNVHLAQENTGLDTGHGAGAVGALAGSAAVLNFSESTVSGMLGTSTNMGGVAQNQTTANVVTAFSR